MGSLVACGGTTQVVAPTSEPETTVEETPEEEVAEPLSTADQFELVKGGVVRLEASACEGDFVGTGFLIDENHIVTVAHVVDEAQEIIAYVDDEVAIAEVVAIDLDRDLALLRTDIPVGSYYFSLGDFEYRTGDQISVIGFPLGLGGVAMSGTVLFMLLGLTSWSDYEKNISWGVIVLYAGAISLGAVFKSSGAAKWLADSLINILTTFNIQEGLPLAILVAVMLPS